jgi:thiamine-phosphate pyrophosphorylase
LLSHDEGPHLIPPVYPITDVRISGLSHLEQIKRLIAAGATLIQLREKHASPREFYEQAVECVTYAHSRAAKIIVNDRADIALMSGADGVHLGQDDMQPAAARRFLGAGKMIGYSTHSAEQAIAAAGPEIDYIAIGPVFQTTTKSNADPVVRLDCIGEIKAAIGDIPLVAIGGIDSTNIADVIGTGADSAAVIRGLLKDPDKILATMRDLLRALGC